MGFGGIIGSIIITVVAVAILSSLGRIAQSVQNRNRRRPEDDLPAARPRQTSSDVERFLEEINRRRQQNVEKRPPADRPASRAVALPSSLPEARPAPRVQPPPLPPVKRAPAREPTQPAPSRRPLQRQETPPPVLIVPVLDPAPTALETASKTFGTASVQRDAKPISPAVKLLMELLRYKQSLRTAILLREIFDPPLSRRQRSV